eukprot:gene1570-1736_t
MPSNLGDLQPVEITKDDCSLFRSVSRMIFQDEKYWFLLKVGSIAAGIAIEELLIAKAGYRFNAFTLRWMYAYYPSAVSIEEDNFPLSSHDNHQEMFIDQMSNSLLEDNNKRNGYSFVSLILETLVLSSFICKNITIFFTATCHCCDKADIGFEGHGMDQNLSIVVDHSKLQHVLPLTIPTEGCPPEQRTRCDAKIRCRVGRVTNSLITCKRCLWKYHPHCIGGENQPSDDCGCSDIPTKSERLSIFSDQGKFKELFALHEVQLRELMKQLYEGYPSCRRNKQPEARYQLNCLIAGIQFDAYFFVTDKLWLWLENDIPEIEKIHRGEDFFRHVVIAEILVYLVMKLTESTRLGAERMARRVLGRGSIQRSSEIQEIQRLSPKSGDFLK